MGALRWRSDNPYLESITGVAEFDEGSGRGRLIQYEQSARMAAANPLLGAGPGNWAVAYPRYAARRDPSMNPSQEGMTFNPWPSSDWIAFVSERGPIATALFALTFIVLGVAAARRIVISANPDEALGAMALLGTIAGVVVSGCFDAVLLLPLPSLLAWTAIGALTPLSEPDRPRTTVLLAGLVLILVSAAGAVRSGAQLAAMHIFETDGGRAALTRAATLDPGNYRIQLRLARSGSRRQRCEHALRARALFPNAAAAQRLARGCG